MFVASPRLTQARVRCNGVRPQRGRIDDARRDRDCHEPHVTDRSSRRGGKDGGRDPRGTHISRGEVAEALGAVVPIDQLLNDALALYTAAVVIHTQA